jgi:hypothetical protein
MRPFIVNQKVLATEQHDERCLEFLMHTICDKVMPELLTNLHVHHRHLTSLEAFRVINKVLNIWGLTSSGWESHHTPSWHKGVQDFPIETSVVVEHLFIIKTIVWGDQA